MISSALIREARLRAHLTQAELGRRVGRPGSMIGRWERGEARPPLETVAELVRAAGFELGLSLAPADEHDRVLIRRALLRTPAERLDEMVRSVRAIQAMARARRPDVAEYDPVRALRVLTRHGARFVVIGDVAARLHGAPLLTEDLGLTPDDDPANLEALAAGLRELGARLRVPDDPDGLQFPVDARMLATNRSWTLTTDAGDLDLVFEPAGSRGFTDLDRGAESTRVADDPPLEVRVASLADVIRTKEAAGRAKDRAALPMLRQTVEELWRRGGVG